MGRNKNKDGEYKENFSEDIANAHSTQSEDGRQTFHSSLNLTHNPAVWEKNNDGNLSVAQEILDALQAVHS